MCSILRLAAAVDPVVPSEHFLGYSPEAWVALFTLALAALTLVLALATIGLWTTSLTALKETRVQHISTSRAFVFLSRFEIHGGRSAEHGAVYRICAYWNNSGLTPTVNAQISMNWQLFTSEIPEDFGYPVGAAVPTFIGPSAEVGSPTIDIPASEVAAVLTGNARVLIWADIAYRDDFPATSSRRTSVCFELIVRDAADGAGMLVETRTFGARNGTELDSRSNRTFDVFGSWLADMRDVREPRRP
jgi:hypothetical protein